MRYHGMCVVLLIIVIGNLVIIEVECRILCQCVKLKFAHRPRHLRESSAIWFISESMFRILMKGYRRVSIRLL